MISCRRFAAAVMAAIFLSTASLAQEPEPPRPCMKTPEFGQFDFWVGTWDVHMADERQAGINEITKEQGGCVLVERWTSARGGTGMSLNYYEPDAAQWVQIWVGADGSLIDIRGGLEEDGSMLLVGFIQTVGQADRHPFRGRWTLLDDGRVRQHFEESEDDGATWQESFDGYYTRQPTAAQ